MTFHNRKLSIGDLVETIWNDQFGKPVMMGVVIDMPEAWQNRKVSVYWNEIGIRLEWLNDIRRVNTE